MKDQRTRKRDVDAFDSDPELAFGWKSTSPSRIMRVVSAKLIFLFFIFALSVAKAHGQPMSGMGLLYPQSDFTVQPRHRSPTVWRPAPHTKPRPYRGYWNEVGYQLHGLWVGAIDTAHLFVDGAYGTLQVASWGATFGHWVPPNPEGNWESAGLRGYAQAVRQVGQAEVNTTLLVNAYTLGLPAIIEGAISDIEHGTNLSMQNVGGALVGVQPLRTIAHGLGSRIKNIGGSVSIRQAASAIRRTVGRSLTHAEFTSSLRKSSHGFLRWAEPLYAMAPAPGVACMSEIFRRAFISDAFGLEGDDLLLMHNLLESGHISIATIPQKQLREMFLTQQIVFREPVIYTKKLTAFSLPLDPNRNAWAPVILVRRKARGTQGKEYVATNGNHRIARHLTENVTPSDLHVIIFEDGHAYKQLFGYDPTGYKQTLTETYSPVTDLGQSLDEFLR